MHSFVNNPRLHDLPDRMLAQIIQTLQSFPNDTVDFSRPVVRTSLRTVYPIFIGLYCALILLGAVANSAMIARIYARPLYSDSTCVFVLNIGFCNMLSCLLLLPLSLVVMLLNNWIFGKVLCYLLPMLQDVPIHVTMATFVVISADRHRKIASPTLAIVMVWLVAICVVLPYVFYVNYIDLETLFGKQFDDVGICTLNMAEDIVTYIRVFYGLLYVTPILLIVCFHIKVSDELARHKLNSQPISQHGRMASEVWTMPSYSSSHSAYPRDLSAPYGTFQNVVPRCQLDTEEVIRNQRYFVGMVGVSTVCLTPLAVLRLVKNEISETHQNSGHFDVTFITFVWLAFLPLVTTPLIFAAWKLRRWESEQNFEPMNSNQLAGLKRFDRTM